MSTVASVTGIAEDKQVLLISNGEALDPSERVCSYSSAGTVSVAWIIYYTNDTILNKPTYM